MNSESVIKTFGVHLFLDHLFSIFSRLVFLTLVYLYTRAQDNFQILISWFYPVLS